MRCEENMDIKLWFKELEQDSQELTIKVAEDYAEFGKKTVERILQSEKRLGKLPEKRGVHMCEDVKLRKNKAKGYMTIGGGKMTGTLWHIVNDGTYRSKGIHFIERTLNEMDNYRGGSND